MPATSVAAWRGARLFSSAATAQVVTSGTSLIVQLGAARTLGVAGFGTFALLLSLLVVLNATVTGLVGDSLTVLDRTDPAIGAALSWIQAVLTVAGALGAAAAAVLLTELRGLDVILYSGLIAAWLSEELGRRRLMAGLRYLRLAVNDGVYGVVTLGLLAPAIVDGNASIRSFFLSMFVGASAAFLVGLAQLPPGERPGVPRRPGNLRAVLRFGAWRSAQTTVSTGTNFLVRFAIATLASTSVLGRVEAARLLAAPIFVALQATGSFLLPFYSRGRQNLRAQSLGRVTAVVVGGAALWGVVVLAFLDPLSALVTGGEYDLSALATTSWILAALAYGAGVPASQALLAVGQASARVFRIRLAGAAVAAGLLFPLAALRPAAVPLGLALGSGLAAMLLVSGALRALRQAPADTGVKRPTGAAGPAGPVCAAPGVPPVRDGKELL